MTPTDDQAHEPHTVEREIYTLRDEIGHIVGELDRRRRRAFDLRLQWRHHPAALPLAGLAIALALSGTAALIVHRHRLGHGRRVHQLRVAFQQMMRHPEHIAHGDARPSEKILTAVAAAAATMLVKRAITHAMSSPARLSPPSGSH